MRIFISLLLFLISGSVSASDSGLKVQPETKIFVLVEKVEKESVKFGLTKELIVNKVELQLRRNGIPVGSMEDGLKSGIYLYVNCGVTGNAFSINVDFERDVKYFVGNDVHSVTASTYHLGGQGIHNNDSRWVIENILNFIDTFSNDFLRSNQK